MERGGKWPLGDLQAHLLADAGITGQDVGVFHDGEGGGGVFPYLQHTAPLGKVSSVLLVLGTALRQPIQPCRGDGGIKAWQRRGNVAPTHPGHPEGYRAGWAGR